MSDASSSQDTGCTADYRRKILVLDRLLQHISSVRVPVSPCDHAEADNGRPPAPTVVLCHGCFDIVHPGHIRYLQFARAQGDLLVVSITGDSGITKGDQRPYIPQELRAENLAALELVDYVVIDPHPTACSLIQALRPDVYVKGREYATSKDPRFLAERQLVEASGGRVIFSSGDVVFSSSRIGEAMLNEDEFAAERLNVVCRRHNIDHCSLSGFLDDMRGKRVLILGDTVIDRYVLCDATDIASESPMMSLSELDRQDYLGGAALVAAQAAALGAEPLLVTGLGEDDLSRWAGRVLEELGVDVRAVRPRPELAMKTRFLVDDHKLFKVDRSTVQPLDSVGERRAADVLISEATRGDGAILYDSGYGIITPGILQQLGATFRHKIPVIAGGSVEPRGNLKALRYFDLLCTSERKLRVAMNDFGSGLSRLAYQMLTKTQAKQIVVTLGKGGIVAFDRPSHDPESSEWTARLCSEHLPSFVPRAVDSLGCSECILAVETLALASGASLMQASYLGEAAAAIQIVRPGLAPVTGDELQQWLDRRPELMDRDDSIPFLPMQSLADVRDEHASRAV
jgi:rfaE bifunctional protein nucleotidyltransferase chain/domain